MFIKECIWKDLYYFKTNNSIITNLINSIEKIQCLKDLKKKNYVFLNKISVKHIN